MALRDSNQRDVAAVELFLLISALGVVLHSWYGDFVLFKFPLNNVNSSSEQSLQRLRSENCKGVLQVNTVVQRIQRKFNQSFIGDNNQTSNTIQLCWRAKVDTIRSIILQQSKCPYDPF